MSSKHRPRRLTVWQQIKEYACIECRTMQRRRQYEVRSVNKYKFWVPIEFNYGKISNLIISFFDTIVLLSNRMEVSV